jgi:GT2 family glycosyltransferase
MTAYNGERYVREAMESILAQTYRDFEFLVVDDGSTDSTLQILEDMARQDPRVVLIKNETNLGLTRSVKLALQRAQVRIIARMDADDIALPSRFQKQINFFNQYPNTDVVGTAYEWIDDSGTILGRRDVPMTHTKIHRALIRTNPFLHASVMMKKSVLDHVHGYNETYKKAQDYDLWLRLSRTSHFANLAEVLMQKRMTKTMISFQSERTQIRFAIRARLDALARGDYPLWCAISLLKPFLATILPMHVVRFLRVHLFGQHIYAHPTLK